VADPAYVPTTFQSLDLVSAEMQDFVNQCLIRDMHQRYVFTSSVCVCVCVVCCVLCVVCCVLCVVCCVLCVVCCVLCVVCCVVCAEITIFYFI